MHTSVLDLGTEEVWARHKRKMAAQEAVAKMKRILSARSVWVKLVRRGYEWVAQVNTREGVRVA